MNLTESTSCAGLNHHDQAKIVQCPACGTRVAKHARGLSPLRLTARGYYCWTKHECDPNLAALYTREQNAALAKGEIIKGQNVIVARGRKVPKGTTGIVFWTGVDDYGNDRVGIKDGDGNTHWTAAKNCDAIN